jgi:hypothetical protein
MGNLETGQRNPELDPSGDLESGQRTGARESTEGQKLEWGPELDREVMGWNWNRAVYQIEELNASLTKGEKPWRLPTKDELVAEFNKTGSTPDGFNKRYCYWSGTTSPINPDGAFKVDMSDGSVKGGNKAAPDSDIIARCVR